MPKYNVTIYFSTCCTVTVDADSEEEAVEYVEKNSDLWQGSEQINESLVLQEGQTDVELYNN